MFHFKLNHDLHKFTFSSLFSFSLVEDGTADDEEQYRKKTKRLRLLLKLYFYSAAKYMNNKCSFHFIYFLFMILQIAKLSCITAQVRTWKRFLKVIST